MNTIREYNMFGGVPPDYDPRQWDLEETAADRHGKRLDEHTEGLLFDIERVNGFAHRLNSDYELGYGDLLPELMQALASWSGSSNGHKGSAELMPKLHAILFRHLRDTVAESEVE